MLNAMTPLKLNTIKDFFARYCTCSMTLAYICVAVVWLLISELYLPYLEQHYALAPHSLDSWGHIGFFLSTATILFVVLRLHQRRIERLLTTSRTQQNELSYFYELPFIGMAIASPDSHQAIQFNTRLCEILGYSKEELMEISWVSLTHPDDVEADLALYTQLLRGERDAYELEKRVICKDGSIRHVHINVQCLRDKNGHITHVYSTIADNTAQITYAEQLKRSNCLYQLLLDTNQLIAREDHLPTLFQACCDIAVEHGGFCLVWISSKDENGLFGPTNYATQNKTLSDTQRNALMQYSPIILNALEGGHDYICNNLADDPILAPQYQAALELGCQSFAALPIYTKGIFRGALQFYAAGKNAFSLLEKNLLTEMAGDIAIAIAYADSQAQNTASLQALQASEARLALAMQAAKLSLWDLNLSTDTATVSHDFYHVLGQEPQGSTIKMLWWFQQMHPDDRAESMASLQYQLEQGNEHIGLEYRVLHNDDDWHWIASTGKVVERDSEGQAKRMLGINMDITQRVEAEILRQRNVERATGLLNFAVEESNFTEEALLQYGLDLAERLTQSKIGFLHFVNEDENSIQLATWSTATHAHCHAEYEQHYPIKQAGIWAECVTQRKAIVCNDYVNASDKKGLPMGHFPLKRFISLPVIRDNTIKMIMGVGNSSNAYSEHDVDTLQLVANDLWRILRRRRLEANLKDALQKQTQLNQELESSQEQLLQSEKMAAIGQLSAGIAHELNNPIGFVHSNLGTLENYVKDIIEIMSTVTEIKDSMQTPLPQFIRLEALMEAKDYDYIRSDLPTLIMESKEGLSRVRQIVQDLKNFSHTAESQWDWADLHKGLDSTLNIVWNELKYKCEVIKEYGDIPNVYCLPSRINQVFMNLMVNASHAIEKSGRITLRTGCNEQEVWVEVADTGKGIPKEILPRIFEPFYTTKPVGQGTGLGLSLSYSIIQKHKGKISVESEVGVGSTFRITLPIRPPLAPKEASHD